MTATPTAPDTIDYVQEARSLLPLIRAEAAECERQGRVTDPVIDAFRATALPRMLVRAEAGGGGRRLPELIRVTQELSSANGGIGWALNFAIYGPSFGLYLERDAYLELFQSPQTSINGAFSPFSVSADAVEGGYVVNGKSSYNSAHRFATHLMAGGIVRRDGTAQMVNGLPEMRTFIIPKEQMNIIPNWPANAMVASESDDAEARNVFVPERFSYPLNSPCPAWVGGAESVIPQLSQLGQGLAAQATGIARGALDAFHEMAVTKVPAASRARLAEQAGAQIAYAEAEGLWAAAHGLVRHAVDEAWARGDAGLPFTTEDAARMRIASVTAVRLARRAVDLVREHSGMSVILRGSALERFVRDIGAITQHTAVGAARLEVAGKVLMGLPPGTPMV